MLIGNEKVLALMIAGLLISAAVAEERPVVVHPGRKTPSPSEPFYCRPGTREFNVSSQSFEVGDTWSGTVGIPRVCGGCYFENAPGSGKPNYQEKIKIDVDWGDGTSDHEAFTADHLTQGKLTLSPTSGLVATHQYTAPITSPAPMRFQISALCVDDQGQWRENINNSCSVSVGFPCTTHPATVGVYSPDPPSVAAIARPIIHGKVTKGALSVVFADDTPPSGTKLTLSSSSALVLFPQASLPPAQTSKVQVSPSQHAANFDIDATKARVGTRFTITVTNTSGGGPGVVTIPYVVR